MIILYLLDTKVMALVAGGRIIGRVYKTRELALSAYFKEAAGLYDKGILSEDSCILN